MKCVAKIMAMPGTRTSLADLCMFGLAACDERGPRFVNVSVRTITNARRTGLCLQNKCASTHRHDRRLRQPDRIRRTNGIKAKDAKRIRGTVHHNNNNNNNNNNKRLSRVQNEMENLLHHDEQELLSVWEGWRSRIRRHKMYTKGLQRNVRT